MKKKDKNIAKFIDAKVLGKDNVEAVKEAYPDIDNYETIKNKGYRLMKRDDIQSQIAHLQSETLQDLAHQLKPKVVNKILKALIRDKQDLNAIKEYYKLIGASVNRNQTDSREVKINITLGNEQVRKAILDAENT